MERDFFRNITQGIYLSRPNRFIVDCRVDNRRTRAYLPNPGRLWELLFPGTILYLDRRNESSGRTDYTVVAVERDGIPIMLHTHVNNLIAKRLIEQGRIPGLQDAVIVKPEVTIGNSRFDFLLYQRGKEVIVEIKSCTLVGNRIAMFPDAITARGKKHLLELACLSEEGKKTAVVFLVHWPRAEYFMPEHHTDLEFSRTLLSVKDRVVTKAVSVEWKPGLLLGRTHDLIIPWQIVEREAHDNGSYIVILKLKKSRRLSVGGLGGPWFNKGYYLYVGSAKADLTRRMERHRKLTKSYHSHIDYLRHAADVHVILPIRTSDDLECEMAKALGKIADWKVRGFGSSDCDCESHLFGMTEDPMHTRSFIDLLQYFRIDRLENYLP